MSVTEETRQESPSKYGWVATVRRTMERPLTSYYLLLGASTMLLAIGLMMVLSSSSVYSYRVHDSSVLHLHQAADLGADRGPGRVAGRAG